MTASRSTRGRRNQNQNLKLRIFFRRTRLFKIFLPNKVKDRNGKRKEKRKKKKKKILRFC